MKKRILLVGMTGGVGGVETYMTNFDKYLDHDKFQVDYLIHKDINEKYMPIITSHDDTNVYKLPGIKSNIFKFFKEVIKFFKNNTYDIVYLNECTSVLFVYVFPVLWKKNIKFIVHSHNGSGKNAFFHKILGMIQNKRADSLYSCSDVASKWMFGNAKDVKLINNSVNLEEYKFNSEKREKIRKELNIDFKEVVIGSVARFDEQKNHKKIIDVFAEYKRICKNSKLVLVGEGEKKQEIISYVKELGLDSDVMFLGVRNDVLELLMGFDVFLLPSLYEGLPFVCVEAQATSLPMLVSNTVSKQIDITNLIYRMELSDSSNSWALKLDEIIKSKIDRSNKIYQDQLVSSGYDILNTIRSIENDMLQ